MERTARQGTLLLTVAQLWHALSGYVIFIYGAHVLGQDAYGDFALVVWTMTTLEIFVVDGLPRAVSLYVSRASAAAAAIFQRGLWLSAGVAVALAAGLAALAGPVAGFWDDTSLTTAVRVSSLDFVAFVAFAVVTQAINGLHRFGLQAGIWLFYSTAKVAAVVLFLSLGWGVEGGVLGYVVGSFCGSVAAWILGQPTISRHVESRAPPLRHYVAYGTPLATQAVAMMALVNVDLWAAKRTATSDRLLGAYAAAATLSRLLFFVFKAFGDALFPAISRSVARGEIARARSAAREGLGLLLLLLLPATGLATGAAGPVLRAVFDTGYGEGALYLEWLAPAASLWTLTAVMALLVAAGSRPWRVAAVLAALLGIGGLTIFEWAAQSGPIGAARASLVAGALGVVVTGGLAALLLGPFIPWRRALVSGVGALILDRALRLWCPEGFWVFLYGGLLYVTLFAAWYAAGLTEPQHTEPRSRSPHSALRAP